MTTIGRRIPFRPVSSCETLNKQYYERLSFKHGVRRGYFGCPVSVTGRTSADKAWLKEFKNLYPHCSLELPDLKNSKSRNKVLDAILYKSSVVNPSFLSRRGGLNYYLNDRTRERLWVRRLEELREQSSYRRVRLDTNSIAPLISSTSLISNNSLLRMDRGVGLEESKTRAFREFKKTFKGRRLVPGIEKWYYDNSGKRVYSLKWVNELENHASLVKVFDGGGRGKQKLAVRVRRAEDRLNWYLNTATNARSRHSGLHQDRILNNVEILHMSSYQRWLGNRRRERTVFGKLVKLTDENEKTYFGPKVLLLDGVQPNGFTFDIHGNEVFKVLKKEVEDYTGGVLQIGEIVKIIKKSHESMDRSVWLQIAEVYGHYVKKCKINNLEPVKFDTFVLGELRLSSSLRMKS